MSRTGKRVSFPCSCPASPVPGFRLSAPPEKNNTLPFGQGSICPAPCFALRRGLREEEENYTLSLNSILSCCNNATCDISNDWSTPIFAPMSAPMPGPIPDPERRPVPAQSPTSTSVSPCSSTGRCRIDCHCQTVSWRVHLPDFLPQRHACPAWALPRSMTRRKISLRCSL